MAVEREKAVQDDSVRLYQFFATEGILTDPETMTSAVINDNDGVLVIALTPVHVRTGVYYADWAIGASQAPGTYNDVWTYTPTGGVSTTQTGEIELHHASWDFITGELSEVTSSIQAHVASLQLMLGQFNDIAVYDEPALLNSARIQALTTYKNWRYDRTITVRAGSTLQSAYYADYRLGKVVFNEAVSSGVPVLVRYHFSYFSPAKLQSLLEWATDEFNLRKPTTTYVLTSLPSQFKQYVVFKAFAEAINILRLDKLMWTTRLIFSNPAEVESVLAAKEGEILNMLNSWRKPRSLISPAAVTSSNMNFTPVVRAHNYQLFGLWSS